jgi:uncharacterized protein (TIGR00255 family)
MTGYGSANVAFPGGRVSAELRTVNHRFLEMKMLLPRLFLPWEDEFRRQIGAKVGRGRLELTLSLAGRAPRNYEVSLNRELAQAYHQALKHLQKELGMDGPLDIQLLASRPDVFQVIEKPGLSPAEIQAAKKAVQDALQALERQRSREGKFLQRDLRGRITTLSKIRRAVATRTGRVQTASRDKLAERVRTFLAGTEVDQVRLLQEVVTLTQKSDITEELVRLQSHLEAMSDLLRKHEPVGKRMDFLLQEINREINTVGAKADDAPIRHLVVEAKEEVEKIREQVQNIE